MTNEKPFDPYHEVLEGDRPYPNRGEEAIDVEGFLADRAKSLGKTVAELLEEDAEFVRGTEFTVDCLEPYEIEFYAHSGKEGLHEDRVAHVEKCSACEMLLTGLNDAEDLRRVRDEIKHTVIQLARQLEGAEFTVYPGDGLKPCPRLAPVESSRADPAPIEPNSFPAALNLARSHYDKRQFVDALEVLAEAGQCAVGKEELASAAMLEGECLRALGRIEYARQRFDQAEQWSVAAGNTDQGTAARMCQLVLSTQYDSPRLAQEGILAYLANDQIAASQRQYATVLSGIAMCREGRFEPALEKFKALGSVYSSKGDTEMSNWLQRLGLWAGRHGSTPDGSAQYEFTLDSTFFSAGQMRVDLLSDLNLTRSRVKE